MKIELTTHTKKKKKWVDHNITIPIQTNLRYPAPKETTFFFSGMLVEKILFISNKCRTNGALKILKKKLKFKTEKAAFDTMKKKYGNGICC